MTAAAPAWLVDAGTIAGAFLAVATALVFVLRSRFVRWLTRRVVVEPILAKLEELIEQVVDRCLDKRPLTNGWGTKAVHRIAEATGADVEAP